MLAEDNSLNRQVAEYVLCDAGAEVVAVVNGLEAIKTFAKAPTGTFDFVIMDVRMPEMDALEATRRIRALSCVDARTVPIIVASANAFADDVRECLEAGMNDHVAKPIDIANLLLVLKKYL